MNKTTLTFFVSLLLFSVTVPKVNYCQSPPPTDPYVFVLVWCDGYSSYRFLEPYISMYKQDLENEGFSVEIRSNVIWPFLPDNAEGIRGLLQNEALTREIAGVLLVGDAPYARYNITVWWDDVPDVDIFPCDLYYMDLDGNWTDSDGNGIYDEHTSGDGDLGPEIWVGRLLANLTGNEEELLINYFDKNHRFRTGELTLPRRALAYLDDHALNYADEINSSLRMIYGNETTLITDPKTTNATHYKNTLNNTLGYEWLHLEAHGNYKKHGFMISSTPPLWTYVYFSDIWSIDPPVFFYNLLACNTADYSHTDYMGGAYIFADTYGLLAVSSTKPGKMSNYSDFYEPIGKGKCIGQAFKEWFEKNGESDRFCHYGLTILGDPTLRTPRTYNQTRDVAITSITAGDWPFNVTQAHAGWNVTIKVIVRNKGVFVETVNVTLYINESFTEKQTVNLFPDADRILTFIWDTTGVPWCHNYTISAYVQPVPDEANTTDNTFVDGKIYVRITGDVNNSGRVGADDKIMVGKSLFTRPGHPKYNPYADVNQSGRIGADDMIMVGKYLFKRC